MSQRIIAYVNREDSECTNVYDGQKFVLVRFENGAEGYVLKATAKAILGAKNEKDKYLSSRLLPRHDIKTSPYLGTDMRYNCLAWRRKEASMITISKLDESEMHSKLRIAQQIDKNILNGKYGKVAEKPCIVRQMTDEERKKYGIKEIV